MTNQELEKARSELKKTGADWALLSSIENVTYVSHYEIPVDFGALATLTYGPSLALVGVADAGSSLLVGNFYQAWAEAASQVDEVRTYNASGVVVMDGSELTPVRDSFLEAFGDMLRAAGLRSGTLAIEERTLPAVALRALMNDFPNLKLIDASGALDTARLTKTERELDMLRFAAEVNKVGHETLLDLTREAGKNEHDMWGQILANMERKAQRQLFVFGELVTGDSALQLAYPGGPKDYITKAGELALMDMSPRVNGYWSDCTNTMVIGGVEPTAEQKRYGVAAREAFHAAADALRPGRKAHEAFDAAAATFDKHGLQIGHYAGHQIGTTVNEGPRLVPTDQTEIQAGMVFSIEPGSYGGTEVGAAARMEKTVIVHQSGPEILCDFEWGF